MTQNTSKIYHAALGRGVKIARVSQPLQSPNLSPIEHVWKLEGLRAWLPTTLSVRRLFRAGTSQLRVGPSERAIFVPL